MKWKLENLYENLEAWEHEYNRLKEIILELPSFQGKLNDFQTFKTYYTLQREVALKAHKLYQYAALKSDLNRKVVENAARVQKMGILLNDLSRATAWESPEILSIGKETVLGFLDNDPMLGQYRFPITKLFHQQAYVLDEKSEALLSNYRQLSSQGAQLYNALAIADNTYKEVTLSDGETVKITSGNYRSYLADLQNPDDREIVFKAIFDHYSEHKHTYAQVYNTVLQADIARMKARNYSSTLESYLFSNNIDPVVYQNLVDVAKENTNLLKRYYAIRTRVLGLDKHRTFDRFMPLATSKSKFNYDEAKDLFFNAIDHLDDTFKAKAKEALEDGYVDVFEQEGKATGAYSWSALDEHPFILLNYDDTLNSVFTLAHEAGHSMHSLFSHEAQPIPTQSYTIFVAEIASTFNEHLLLDYFIKTNKGTTEDKITLLQQSIDDIMGTFYRQTLFAAYELEAHKLAEAGTPITYEALSKIMVDLYKHFYDIDITEEPGKEYVWAYIPHLFNTPYYVYQYATSFAASLKLYELVKEDPSNIEKHMTLLRAGGDDFPVEQVKKAGIDLTNKDAFTAVVNRLETLLDELELALNE
ncbi:oligoendopeptidase F [Liberiplasma polymorphum]|uniref:oligoendopeptidase F n=1 Tax=Liberiplasma polymorphum TaxID=3374570 RepID=UPI0037721F1B